MNNQIPSLGNMRIRKSEKLTKQEHRAFINWVKGQETKIDAAATLGVARQTLDRLYIIGSGHPDTIQSIRKLIA